MYLDVPVGVSSQAQICWAKEEIRWFLPNCKFYSLKGQEEARPKAPAFKLEELELAKSLRIWCLMEGYH